MRLYVVLPGVLQAANPRTGAPSWVAELEDDETDQTCSQAGEPHRQHRQNYFNDV